MISRPKPTAEQLMAYLQMQQIPHEGPHFKQLYKSKEVVDGTIGSHYKGTRYAYTVGLGLGTEKDFSAMHKLATDEIWNFEGGDPLEMLLLYPDGTGKTVIIGPDILAGQNMEFVVPKGVWQGTKAINHENGYSLVGNTLTPGFEYADYTPGYRDQLQKGWPQFSDKIAERTREGSLIAPAPVVNEQLETTTMTTVPPSPKVSSIQELVGLAAPTLNKNLSVAHFLMPSGMVGHKYVNSAFDEVILVSSGTAILHFNDKTETANPGQVLDIPAKTVYSIEAYPGTDLEAYAICAPPFQPEQHQTVNSD